MRATDADNRMATLSLPPLTGRAPRVLVAIDAPDARRLAVDALELDGHDVFEASSADGLIDHVRVVLPDLVLLDLGLSEGTGLEVLGDLRMLDASRQMPVVLFSAREIDEDAVVHGLLGGADDVVVGVTRPRELCARVSVQLRNRRDRDQLKSALKERSRLLGDALTDPLTEVGNRRAGDLALARACDQASALLLIVDLDHFKQVNDTWGHHVGDEVLRASGRCLTDLSREGDVVARYGGEEFVVIVGGAPPERHRAIAERFLAGLRALALPLDLAGLRVTASLGAASWSAAEGPTTPAELFEVADRSLYAAKRGGRDALVFAHVGGRDTLTELSSTEETPR